MRMPMWMILAAFVAVLPAGQAMADMDAKPGSPTAGDWVKRTPASPNPDKVIVPSGYKGGGFKAGPAPPSAAADDKDDNVCVAISGQLFNTLDTCEPPHVKMFGKDGRL